MKILVGASVLSIIVICLPAYAVSLRGTVVDEHGQPLAHVTLCGQWGPEKLGSIPRCLNRESAETDSSGGFDLPTPPLWGDELAMMVFNPDHTLGATVSISHADLTQPLRIELHKLQPVRYHFVVDAEQARYLTPHLYSASDNGVLGFTFGASGTTVLPPGRYTICTRARDADLACAKFVVGAHPVTLPPVHFVLSKMARHFGKGTPTIASLVDMDQRPFPIGTFKGQWTLLYFWTVGCLPCIEHGLPELIAYTKSPAAKGVNLRIIALHTGSAADFNTYHSRTIHLEETLWHEVPQFPLVYDIDSHTSTNWGISHWPTYALIDPKGNLIRAENFEDVKTALGIPLVPAKQ